MNIHRIYIYAPVAGAYPADLEQALAQGEQLLQSDGGQAVPEALLTMAAKLEEYADRWSEGVNENEDEEGELQERLGNLKARVQRNGVPVISFEMPHEGWQRLLWEMVEKAGPLGLVVVDDQALTAFLPEGKVYPAGQLAAWLEVVAGLELEDTEVRKEENLPKTLRQYVGWAEPMFEEYLKKHGFVEKLTVSTREPCYQKYIGEIKQVIHLYHQMQYPHFSSMGTLVVHHSKVMEIVERFGFKNCDQSMAFFTLANQTDALPTKTLPISRSAVDYEIRLFDQYVMNLANMAIDIEGIDRVLNNLVGVSERSKIFLADYLPHRLVIARLARRKDFDELTERLRSSIPPLRVNYIEKIDQLIQYLRDEVQPLV